MDGSGLNTSEKVYHMLILRFPYKLQSTGAAPGRKLPHASMLRTSDYGTLRTPGDDGIICSCTPEHTKFALFNLGGLEQ